MTRPGIPYPWISTLAALLIISWQFILAQPQWIHPDVLPDLLLNTELQITAAIFWVILVILDIYRFLRGWSGYRARLQHHKDQISELFDSRRELGSRARTYSEHAEKLKLFISDKLLEYIEYDEKFLHFKNIASEVRHNGVISYDKAQTALKKAAALCADQLQHHDQIAQFEDAAESLLYLWDLLDIATTDNISLHVANRIYDSEEYYFQSTLNNSDPSTLPYVPTFSMFNALHKTLTDIVDNPAAINESSLLALPYSYADDHVKLRLESDSDMLGNINHMVLLLENLLNNALYYAAQQSAKNHANRINILLTRQQDKAVVEIYNHGPRIKDEDSKHIFQLGFSSRRIRDHHGKGLGLYFVNEICKGFEGKVSYQNIENQPCSLSLRIELANGEIQNHFIELIENNGKALCHLKQGEESASASLTLSFNNPLSSVEVSAHSGTTTQMINHLNTETVSHTDCSNPLIPRWKIEINNRKKSARLTFKPVDVRGVNFRVELPTAQSRLEFQEGEL